MRWIGEKLLTSCLTLLVGVSFAGAARALSVNAADISVNAAGIDCDTVLTSLNGQLEFSNISFYLDNDADFTLTRLSDGLQLTGPMFAANGDSAEFYFSYQVSAVDPNALIHGASLFAPTSIEDDFFPTFAKTGKTIFNGPPGPQIGVGRPIGVLETANFDGSYTEFAQTSFDPRATITVMDGVRLFTGGPGDTARADSISNRFAVVPEPGTLGLLGSGLLGLSLAGRRFRR